MKGQQIYEAKFNPRDTPVRATMRLCLTLSDGQKFKSERLGVGEDVKQWGPSRATVLKAENLETPECVSRAKR